NRVWQARPIDAKPYSALSATERQEVRKDMADRLPKDEAELNGWKFYRSGDHWDGWHDERWGDEDDVVQGVALLRKGQESLPALRYLEAKINELNEPGHLLPGVKILLYYNRTELIKRTTSTVYENLLVGMTLVTAILLMFLSNVRAALIVAINIPL